METFKCYENHKGKFKKKWTIPMQHSNVETMQKQKAQLSVPRAKKWSLLSLWLFHKSSVLWVMNDFHKWNKTPNHTYNTTHEHAPRWTERVCQSVRVWMKQVETERHINRYIHSLFGWNLLGHVSFSSSSERWFYFENSSWQALRTHKMWKDTVDEKVHDLSLGVNALKRREVELSGLYVKPVSSLNSECVVRRGSMSELAHDVTNQ